MRPQRKVTSKKSELHSSELRKSKASSVTHSTVEENHCTRRLKKVTWLQLLHLPRYDFLLYVDVDVVVMNPETCLEDIVDVDHDQVLAADSNGVHCGVWLV